MKTAINIFISDVDNILSFSAKGGDRKTAQNMIDSLKSDVAAREVIDRITIYNDKSAKDISDGNTITARNSARASAARVCDCNASSLCTRARICLCRGY